MKGKAFFSATIRNGGINVPRKKPWEEKDTEEKTKLS